MIGWWSFAVAGPFLWKVSLLLYIIIIIIKGRPHDGV